MNLSRFESLWQRNLLENTESRAPSVFAEVEKRYREDHRHYHNDEHIDHCLALLDFAKPILRYPDAVELAIWFHDVVYISGGKDNEMLSVQLFRALSDQQLQESVRQRVAEFIMSTKHDNHPQTIDEKILVDIDLSSFGLDWERFAEDGMNVRKEQAHLTDDEFHSRQMRFQESLLKRERFYYSDLFHQRFEAIARRNLSRHLEDLRSQGFSAG